MTLPLMFWRFAVSGSHTSDPTPMKQNQRVWDKTHIEATQQELLSSAAGPRERARLLAVQSKESGAWLNVFGALP